MVGAGSHQRAHGFGLMGQHCIVQRTMLVVFGPVHVDQLGRCGENGFYRIKVAVGSGGA